MRSQLQSSVFTTDLETALGVQSSCVVTGLQRGAWWALRMARPVNVTSVYIEGGLARVSRGLEALKFDLVSGQSPAYQVRVGFNFSDVGDRGLFEHNELCFYSRMLVDRAHESCEQPVFGDVITIQAVDPTSYDHLQLCSVRFNVDESQI